MVFSIWTGRRAARATPQNRTRFAELAQVRAYWEGLRRGDQLPLREAIDPRGLAGALDVVFMAERIGPGLARFRIAGMKINDLCGTEVRGLPLSLLFAPHARPQFAGTLERVFAQPTFAELAVDAEHGLGRPALSGRMLLLPLISTRGVPDLCLGCLALEGDIGRSPRRFTIKAAVEHVQTSPAVLELAEQPEPFRPKPHLRLVP